jgi:cyclic nucleotide-binding protein/FHA domain-containing protein
MSLGPPRGFLSRHLVSYPAGARIYGEGEVGAEMYAIRSGEVEITKVVSGRARPIERLAKGDVFGEASLLEDLPRDATASARSDVELVRVNGATLESMLENNPEIAIRMLRALARRLRQAGGFEKAPTFSHDTGGRRPTAFPLSPPKSSAESGLLVSSDWSKRFPLNAEGDTVVGHADASAGEAPDVDLAGLDSLGTVSRRHARFYRVAGADYVMEEIGVANGTFVNGRRLATGTPAAVRHGDLVAFGLVALTFWNPAA